MQTQFATGQRWISDTESDLGLGTILDTDLRQVTLIFPATGETRIYAKESAPLTRVEFSVGDTVTSLDGWGLTIEEVIEDDGLNCYLGTRHDSGKITVLEETRLDHWLRFRTPKDRLFRGLVDGQRWYALRQDVFRHRHRIAQSRVRGLTGARVALLDHQIYIALQALEHEHPRLLLADEVGLGKTIEAGLILQARRVRGQLERLLIIVPETLQHQWLVEMRRRFNLNLALLDRERIEALADSAPEGNAFLAEQDVLCSLELLSSDPAAARLAIDAGWSTLVVDEAHRLDWSPEHVSDAYRLVERLASETPSVLLLTATPEQLGRAGHFARLRLLDPERFSTLEGFLAEEARYERVAAIADRLSRDQALQPDDITHLEQLMGTAFDAAERAALGHGNTPSSTDLGTRLIDSLVDLHGTGRLLFRNTRQAISGFPERRLVTHELADTRIETLADWLREFVADIHPQKALLIAARQETVVRLGECLRQLGIDNARFHEGMSIVERDRAAAWFADADEGCPLLLCSEIGSEGRNFQFLHRLVTIELPTSPDLLEQRIGRLDRIGQRQTVEVHVPAADGSRDARLCRWYHEGFDAFETVTRAGAVVSDTLGPEVESWLDSTADARADTAFIARTREQVNDLEARLDSGRDRLLELRSNRPDEIQAELDELVRNDRDFTLQDFMTRVFDRFGVDVNEQSDHWIIAPSDHLQVSEFPGLDPDGMRVTFDRQLALAREDVVFLSWDHPMVSASMELILDEGYGQADVQVIKSERLTAGLGLLEAAYVLQCTAPPVLSIDRYLPQSLVTFHIGLDGRDYTAAVEHMDFDALRQRYDRNALRRIIQTHRASLEKFVELADRLAERQLPALIESAREAVSREHEQERERLTALARHNPSIDAHKVDVLDERAAARREALGATRALPVGLCLRFNA